jgi:hypothetical protein
MAKIPTNIVYLTQPLRVRNLGTAWLGGSGYGVSYEVIVKISFGATII